MLQEHQVEASQRNTLEAENLSKTEEAHACQGARRAFGEPTTQPKPEDHSRFRLDVSSYTQPKVEVDDPALE